MFGTDGLMLKDDKEKIKQFYFSLPKGKIIKLEMINQIKQNRKQNSEWPDNLDSLDEFQSIGQIHFKYYLPAILKSFCWV